MISERKKLILQTIIKEHVKTAQPVSSGLLVTKYKLGVSPATVRNDMMELEEEGYIFQPHTSAGRIPTVWAYSEEAKGLNEEGKCKLLKDSEKAALEEIFQNDESAFKQIAKLISEFSGSAVFWAFHKNSFFHTGLANLFAQPEFRQVEAVCDVSVAIDKMEEIISALFEELPLGTKILVGEENPFGIFLSVTLLKYNNAGQLGVFGILSPIRADYGHNLSLVEFIQEQFK
ncbi:MAG: DeoR family transcriptional regulator [Patescibacteria group bacterium]|nr:DeoR family transcriptional regulator [Patescibacteria group bacterium]